MLCGWFFDHTWSFKGSDHGMTLDNVSVRMEKVKEKEKEPQRQTAGTY